MTSHGLTTIRRVYRQAILGNGAKRRRRLTARQQLSEVAK